MRYKCIPSDMTIEHESRAATPGIGKCTEELKTAVPEEERCPAGLDQGKWRQFLRLLERHQQIAAGKRLLVLAAKGRIDPWRQ